jgi:hypothetical protein
LKRTIIAALLVMMPNVAQAVTADCLLEVDGNRYIDGLCSFDPISNGSFQISARGYFAYVFADYSSGDNAYWNGEQGASHAHESLGRLNRRAACWVNSFAKVCAWKPGERLN